MQISRDQQWFAKARSCVARPAPIRRQPELPRLAASRLPASELGGCAFTKVAVRRSPDQKKEMRRSRYNVDCASANRTGEGTAVDRPDIMA